MATKAEKLLKKGRTLAKKGKFERALKVMRDACEHGRYDPDVWIARAEVAEQAKNKEEQVEALVAGAVERFRLVTLPMLSPVIFFNGIMAVIGSFQVFTQALVMTGGEPGDLTRFYVLYLYNQAFDFYEMGYASAMAWILFVVVLLLTAFVMRGSRRFVHYEALQS